MSGIPSPLSSSSDANRQTIDKRQNTYKHIDKTKNSSSILFQCSFLFIDNSRPYYHAVYYTRSILPIQLLTLLILLHLRLFSVMLVHCIDSHVTASGPFPFYVNTVR